MKHNLLDYSRMLKKVSLAGILFFLVTPYISHAAIVHESCTSGIYRSEYAMTPSCNTCGYITRSYINTSFDIWDWFYNLDGTEKMISSASYGNVIPLNGSNLTVGTQPFLTANNFPAGFGLPGVNEALIFLGRNLRFTTPVASRATPIGRVEYNIRSANVVPGGNFSVTMPWSYHVGTETVGLGGITTMTASQINLGTSTKTINTDTISNHKECYVFLGAWCGDGTVDGGNGETCDAGTQNGVVGGACNASCQIVPCSNGGTSGAQGAPITSTSPGLCPVGEVVNNFTATLVGTNTSYTWGCNAKVGGSCSANYSTTVIPPGGGGGGGPTCTPGNFTRDSGGIVPVPISSTTPGLCPVGETIGNFSDVLSGTSHRYSWSCNNISAGLACVAFYNSGGGGGGLPSGGTPITVPGSSSVCGNGVIERPNGLGQYENCDTNAPWCVSCNIASTNPGTTPPGNLTITTPGSSALNISTYRLIVGNNVPLFSGNDQVSFATNTPMYLENKLATVTNKSSILNGSTVSKNINNIGVGGDIRFKTDENKTYDGSGNLLSWTISYDQRTYPRSIVLFQGSELQGIKGDTSTIRESYQDTIVTNPTYRGQGLYASLQYLESPFYVRVSRPIIGNTAGGSAFIGSPLGYNVNTVVQTFFNNLRSGNFTTSTINTSSAYELSSATRSVSNNSLLSQSISNNATTEEGKINNISIHPSEIAAVTSISSEFEINSKSTYLGDTTNIRVFKDGDVSINGDLDISGVKTVIIENGNLIINKNIHYSDINSSFAWIVKNGNIIIADSVKEIAGVYVTLAGAIESNGVNTPNRLTVDGSLYGNTSDLITNRSYVRGQTGYTVLNVGVIVNYSNRAIMYPPPFLSRFLDQYSLQRVAR